MDSPRCVATWSSVGGAGDRNGKRPGPAAVVKFDSKCLESPVFAQKSELSAWRVLGTGGGVTVLRGLIIGFGAAAIARMSLPVPATSQTCTSSPRLSAPAVAVDALTRHRRVVAASVFPPSKKKVNVDKGRRM